MKGNRFAQVRRNLVQCCALSHNGDFNALGHETRLFTWSDYSFNCVLQGHVHILRNCTKLLQGYMQRTCTIAANEKAGTRPALSWE
jgi:hypothetical protein